MMISQRCPKCSSVRVRRGYRKTPVYMKVIGRYYLLCNACNWEFTGFALPGTVTAKSSRRLKKSGNETNSPGDGEREDAEPEESHSKKDRNRVRVRS